MLSFPATIGDQIPAAVRLKRLRARVSGPKVRFIYLFFPFRASCIFDNMGEIKAKANSPIYDFLNVSLSAAAGLCSCPDFIQCFSYMMTRQLNMDSFYIIITALISRYCNILTTSRERDQWARVRK